MSTTEVLGKEFDAFNDKTVRITEEVSNYRNLNFRKSFIRDS